MLEPQHNHTPQKKDKEIKNKLIPTPSMKTRTNVAGATVYVANMRDEQPCYLQGARSTSSSTKSIFNCVPQKNPPIWGTFGDIAGHKETTKKRTFPAVSLKHHPDACILIDETIPCEKSRCEKVWEKRMTCGN
jgi:hypothetical protein